MDVSVGALFNLTVQGSAMLPVLSSFAVVTSLATVALSVSITDIQGPAFLSPLVGQAVAGVAGLVTAKGSQGFYLSGTPSSDVRVSNGIHVFTTSSSILAQVSVGDQISVNGRVAEFHSASNDLSSTEIDSPTNIVVHSSGNPTTPVVLGRDRSPPTQQLSALDGPGNDGFLAVPNNRTLQEAHNSTLQPTQFGLDFWESLEGQLVTVRRPTVTDFENSFGEFWVYGDWPVTGKNSRGGLTMNVGSNGVVDANPEVIQIGSPLDGSKNPHVAVGQVFGDITGVIQFQFGFYYVLPLTSPVLVSSPSFTVPPTTLRSSATDPCALTLGDYNVENLAPTSSHLPTIAQHIAVALAGPDLVFVQEIQDNSGPTNDGTVSANVTLQTLVSQIKTAGGPTYSFIDIDPVDGQDGGQPGGNIRQAYLFRPDKLALAGNSPVGGSLAATAVTKSSSGVLGLTLNPGRIDPTNDAWRASRKPLAAVWESVLPRSTGKRFFTVNLHLTAKSGSSTTQGNARPPVNLGVDQRTAQVSAVATFVDTILSEDPNASIIVGGDCNEFLETSSVYASFTNILTDVDAPAGVTAVERYTYVFDQQNEQLDHIFVSNAIVNRRVAVEHIHVNNWSPLLSQRVSDHDPSVAKLQVC